MIGRRKVFSSVYTAALMLTGVVCLSAAAQAQSAAAPPQAAGSPFLDRLHGDLQLNSGQEDGWKSFVQAYHVDPQEMARERDAETKMPSLTGPERTDLAVSLAEQDLAGMRNRGDALKAFYTGLSPAQQKVFDRDTLEQQ